ncbi:Paired amphipathic helix protein Sin3-like 5 [Citrus sinensis]|uniref:Paired amphipathic helix protein Sin3-like 5 n=1 Tax=Citrus sinensis TaxID=2711 RepID=A0ACB8I0M7_CITSI|nr:Paired amphipathic helix protein Sin3-like 5 [Citrus sinensis]
MRRSHSHLHSSDLNEACKYVAQVKAFTAEVGIDFAEFTSLLGEISRNPRRMNDPKFIKTVNNIFRDRQDLIVGLNTFLPERYQISVNKLQIADENRVLESAINLVNMFVGLVSFNNSEAMKNLEGKKGTGVQDSEDCMKRVYRKGLDLFERVRENITGDDSIEYMKFLKQIHGYNRSRVAMSDVVVQFIAKNSQVKAEFEEFLEQCEDIGSKRRKIEKKTCTPSYWYIPTKNTNCCGSPELNVLNDEWVSRSLVRDDKFKNRTITLKEEILNKCEDNRHELDISLNRLKSCAVKMEKILKLITTMSENDKTLNVQEPAIAVPVILRSLKMKAEECEEYRIGFNSTIWAPIQAGNYSVLKADERGEIILKILLKKSVLYLTLLSII